MTLIDKVKTLIEYAKCGMGFCQLYKRDVDNPADLYFPKEIDLGNGINSSVLVNMKANLYIRSIKGNLTSFGVSGGQGQCQNMLNLKTVELPKCTSFYLPYGFFGCEELQTVKLPALTKITSIATFDSCDKLEHLEFGALTEMHKQLLVRATGIKTIVVGKGTNCTLYFEYCPELTNESVQGIIDNLATVTTKQYLYLDTNVKARLTTEQIAAATQKGWTIA